MSSLEQFHSGFGEIITNQFAKCIEFSGDLDVTFDEYSEKLLDSLANIHGKNVINETENRMEDHINEIYNNDLYLSIGLCKGNETGQVGKVTSSWVRLCTGYQVLDDDWRKKRLEAKK